MAEPRVAVVIPIFKQSSLAIEAIESVLRQRTSFAYRVIAINDGCPFAETEAVCRSYAWTYPEKFSYIYRKNGGLSAARNTGIKMALAAWPSIEAIQILDSDDRLGPMALEKAYQALCQNPQAGWAFPNTKRFGFGREYYDTAGPWSLLELIAVNYITCGSLIRRRVFEQGLGYDEQMKLGYEDWDLWIQSAGAGMPGCHVRDMEFAYRKRAESMLSSSYRSHDQIMGYMRKKHAPLYTLRRAIELEQEEFPRYALFLTDTNRLVFTTDLDHPRHTVSLDELGARLLRAVVHPRLDRFPIRFVITSEAFLRLARKAHFAAGLLWMVQARLEHSQAHFAGVRLETRLQTDACLQIGPTSAGPLPTDLALVMLQSRLVHECLQSPTHEWLQSLFTETPRPKLETISLRYGQPQTIEAFPADALQRLLTLVEEHGPSYRDLPTLNLLQGKHHMRMTNDPCVLTRHLFQAGPLYPLVPDRQRLQVGFVMPICDFGGAERVSLNLAREAKRFGWAVHLFVVGSGTVRLLGEFKDVFESIAVLDSPELWRPDQLVGILGTMDVIVNNNCAYVNEVLAPLRRAGVKTFSHLHSVTLGPRGIPCGQPFEALRYEHSLDGILVISRKLRNWCRSLGVPEEKVLLVPNAPSFAASEALVRTTLIERGERTAAEPLRVMFIGRFDPEKGLDRLMELVSRSQQRELPLAWQIVGREVLGHGGRKMSLDPIRRFLKPPALSSAALSRVYRWADVVVMLSRFEGVPLTILEAQRFGCVVLSTAVGAIEELIEPGQTGFLFSNDLPTPKLVDQMLECLVCLHEDRSRLLEVARASAALRREATWSRSFQVLAKAVHAMTSPQTGGPA
jgi:glycosyltransferase involved in cell wall biosynthesis/GT2 family glycosyltransferase